MRIVDIFQLKEIQEIQEAKGRSIRELIELISAIAFISSFFFYRESVITGISIMELIIYSVFILNIKSFIVDKWSPYFLIVFIFFLFTAAVNKKLLDNSTLNYFKNFFLLISTWIYIRKKFGDRSIYLFKYVAIPLFTVFLSLKLSELYILMRDFSDAFTTYFGEERPNFALNLNNIGLLACFCLVIVKHFHSDSIREKLLTNIVAVVNYVIIILCFSRFALIFGSILLYRINKKLLVWFFFLIVLFFQAIRSDYEVQYDFLIEKLSSIGDDGSQMRGRELFIDKLVAFVSEDTFHVFFGLTGSIEHNTLISILLNTGLVGLLLSIVILRQIGREVYAFDHLLFFIILADVFIGNNIQNMPIFAVFVAIASGLRAKRRVKVYG